MNEKKITITELSKLSGVNSVTLRAWERRYGLLKPQRTSKGHRFFTESDLEKVIRIVNYINQGVNVGRVKHLIDDTEVPEGIAENTWDLHLEDIYSAAKELNDNKIRHIYKNISYEYPFSTSGEYFLRPVIEFSISRSDKSIHSCFLLNIIQDCITNSYLNLNQTKLINEKVVIFNTCYQLTSKVMLLGLLLREKGFDTSVFHYGKLKHVEQIHNQHRNPIIIFVSNDVPDISELNMLREIRLNRLYFAGAKIKLNEKMIPEDYDNISVFTDPLDIYLELSGGTDAD